jgi:hypothetical protein
MVRLLQHNFQGSAASCCFCCCVDAFAERAVKDALKANMN